MTTHDRLTPRRLLLLAALLGASPAALPAQDTPQHLRIRLEPAAAPLLPINLRPNTTTPLDVRLLNPTPDDFRNFTVKLVQIVKDQPQVVAQCEVAKLLPREEVRLVFPPQTKVSPAKANPGKDSPAKNGAATAGIELVGPPFKLQVWIEPKLPGDFAPLKQEVELAIREPRDYLAAQARYDAAGAKVRVRLALDGRERLVGPPQVPVELTLGPALAPTKKGTFRQIVVAPRGVAELHASGVGFIGPAVRAGQVSVSADGYARAFVFPLTLRGSGELSEVDFRKRIGVRVVAPAYSRPAAMFPVRVELDGPLHGDYRVAVALDRAGTRELFNQVVMLPGLRQQRIRLVSAPSGELRCWTEVRDWQTEFDTTGVRGKMWLRVAVLYRGRLATEYEPVEVAIPAYTSLDAAPLELDAETRHVYARVVQDDSPPEGLEFIRLPADWPANKPLPVRIKAAPRADDQAPIGSVTLLRGKVPDDGKLAPDALLGTALFDAKTGSWRATLPPQNKVGPFELSALAATRTGVTAFETATIELKTPIKPLARITGTVTYGPNPVPNASLVLLDDKGKEKGSTKSGSTGAFTFEKITPGNYVIAAAQSFPALVGQAKVQVPEGVELVEKVAIKLLSK